MTTTVLAVPAQFIAMTSRLVGDVVSSRVVNGRGYLFVRGDVGQALAFVDPFDDELLLEAHTFLTSEAADAWIAADVAQRGSPQ